MSSSKHPQKPHIALLPCAGMGHLIPFFRLASMLSSHNCTVTLITAKSTVSIAESTHISSFLATDPEINHLEFDLLPSSNPAVDDPFLAQYDAITRSAPLFLSSLVSSSSSPPVSAIFIDLMVAGGVAPVAADLSIPYYILFTSSAMFLCFLTHLPGLLCSSSDSMNHDHFEIPGMNPLPKSSIPPMFLNPNHLLTANSISNINALPKARGILMNTFEWFEPVSLAALCSGRVSNILPPVLPVGPLQGYEPEEGQIQCTPWLDVQPEKSVVYVSFGSRTAMSKDQIRELGSGLDKSGCRFLWVIKTSKVDKDDKEDLKSLLGDSFLERTESKAMIVKGWANQAEILGHPAVGGFVSHCGWNSVVEAAQQGKPMLAWPQLGDQRVNATVAVQAGLGIWEQRWGLEAQGLVKEEEIAEKVVELMKDERLRSSARKVGEEATTAAVIGGSSQEVIKEVIRNLG